ncbi:hypothetical protein [Rhizobium mongolense]|jgi:hypothetical protein|uniref:hypothetical protein n=1 Tax=Rhizobium mongolense TaxID=57676 RepID=UPI0034A59B73
MGNVDRYCGCCCNHSPCSDLLAAHECTASHTARRRDNNDPAASYNATGNVDRAGNATGNRAGPGNSGTGNAAGYGTGTSNPAGNASGAAVRLACQP